MKNVNEMTLEELQVECDYAYDIVRNGDERTEKFRIAQRRFIELNRQIEKMK